MTTNNHRPFFKNYRLTLIPAALAAIVTILVIMFNTGTSLIQDRNLPTSNNGATNVVDSENYTVNKFPNVTDRKIVIQITNGSDDVLALNVSDAITLLKSTNMVLYQPLVPINLDMIREDEFVFSRDLIVKDSNQNVIRLDSLFYPDIAGSLEVGAERRPTAYGVPVEAQISQITDKAVIYYTGKLREHGKIYRLNFASFVPVTIKFPENVIIISNNTKTYTEFWYLDYDKENGKPVFKGPTSTFVLHYGGNLRSDMVAEIHWLTIYDMSFRLRET